MRKKSESSAIDISLPLDFTNAAPTSRMFSGMSENLYKAVGSEPITYNHHKCGVSPEIYSKEKSLNNFFKILSLNDGKDGKTFISSVEGKNHSIIFCYH